MNFNRSSYTSTQSRIYYYLFFVIYGFSYNDVYIKHLIRATFLSTPAGDDVHGR